MNELVQEMCIVAIIYVISLLLLLYFVKTSSRDRFKLGVRGLAIALTLLLTGMVTVFESIWLAAYLGIPV